MGLFADRLIDRLLRSESRWPLAEEKPVWKDLSLWIAFRENDRERLREAAGWQNLERRYLVDPLPRKINHAFASLLFGSKVEVIASDERDQELLDGIEAGNNMAAELQRAEIVCSSEGEVWWRGFVDPEVSDVPMIEWHSRTSVLPYWVGGKLKAAAFISRYDVFGNVEARPVEVFRHFEVHDFGSVTNVLFRSAREDQLGRQCDLAEVEETSLLQEYWQHDLPGMLAGRIPNMIGVDPTLGVSDFDGISDLLLLVNEATAIAAENARLTAKRRVVVPASVTDEQGNLDASKEILVAENVGGTLGEGNDGGPFKVLEYSYDSAALIAHKNDLVNTALSRVGIVPQYVGAGSITEGLATSGTALRVRLLPTIAAGDERAQFWDDELPKIMLLMQLLDALPIESGGFATKWVDPTTAPAVERGSTLPVDETEEVARHSDAVSALIESRETAVRALHPDWDDTVVAEELARIKEDQGLLPVNPFGPGDGPPEEEEDVEDVLIEAGSGTLPA